MHPTVLKYMNHGDLLEDTATIVAINPHAEGKEALVLDTTIFYPQGGGQPYDQGTITGATGSCEVEEVRIAEDTVSHSGGITGRFSVGDQVTLSINKERRSLNSRDHTAGHIIDIALKNCGVSLVATRGYHFPEGAYCEYDGTLEEQERKALHEKLQNEVNNIVQCNLPVTITMMSREELQSLAGYVPEAVTQDNPARAMVIVGYPPIPCGGTHAKTTDIGTLTIMKIKNKSGNLRISYEIT